MRVDTGTQTSFNLTASMYSFQSSGAQLTQSVSNIPTLTAPRILDLERASGRIRGVVNVTGNVASEGLTYMRMYSSVQLSSTASSSGYPESYSGYVTKSQSAALYLEVFQPMPALSNVSAYGTATLIKAKADGSTCNISVSLPSQYVNVPRGIVDAPWTIDMTKLACPTPADPPKTGNLQGNVTLSGLDGLNSGALSYQRVYAASIYSTPLYDASGSYSISAIPVGNWGVGWLGYFKPPYDGYLNISTGNVSIADGVTTSKDISQAVGTVHGTLNFNGIWGLSNIYSGSSAHLNGAVQISDYVTLLTGNIDFVTPVGNAYLYRIAPRFYKNTGTRTFDQYYYRYYNSSNSPLSAAIAVGENVHKSIDIATSAIDQGFYLPDATVGIKQLSITGKDYTPGTDTLIGSKEISLSSNLTGNGSPTNGVVARLHGEPACYKAIATANGDDGGTYRKEFTFDLMTPQCTAAGYSAPNLDFTTCDGKSVGAVAFNNTASSTCTTTAGCTVINTSNIGPRPPVSFRVLPFKGGPQYYDVVSTVQFCPNQTTATVCFSYDPNATPDPNKLKLGHYVCDPVNVCDWQKIEPTTVDTGNNKICGETPSFSIFAVLEPLDKDSDGIFDGEDNCIETPNPKQEDLDNDGIGDACDSDIDGDGIVDDEDRCPLIASTNNNDLDEDGYGDICDDDIDGDNIVNADDNCPLSANANQVDFDSDGKGDSCDLDDDNDGIEDSADSCAGTEADALIDGNGCSSAQLFVLACHPEGAYQNHGKYVSCIAKEAERQLVENLITEEMKDTVVSAAAQSGIGKKK